ncbi:hypothetical protein CEXT_791501 [Caerostris extrusa]|uniref:Uncharacterized protein n=1 Tax=Caerostris extrusa TaxID=172846 RepID=A0AAV4X896_CAEEX|nr:hypothetical protein CEXT_791501 [Caerostris extrusa]
MVIRFYGVNLIGSPGVSLLLLALVGFSSVVNFRIVDGIMRRTKQENVTEGNALQLSKEVPMRRGANERFLSSIQFCLNFYSVSYDIQSDVF